MTPPAPLTAERWALIYNDLVEEYPEYAKVIRAHIAHQATEIARLEARVAAREANAWREIASAPKDGTKLCLWNGEESGDGRFFLDRWIWDEGFDCEPQPTHWTPLPPAPEAKP